MKFVKSKYFGHSVLIFFVLFLVWSLGPMQTIQKKLEKITGSKELLDLKPCSSSTEIYHYISKTGEPGREVLIEMYTFHDLIFPLVYGLFLTMGLVYFISRCFPEQKRMLWWSIPVSLMMIADYLENLSILVIISNPAEKLSIANYVGLLTSIKWGFGLISILLFLVFGIIFLVKKIIPKNNSVQ